MLFEENSSSNLNVLYYDYLPFSLESKSEAECRTNFRVEKHYIPLVEDAIQILQYFVCNQGTECEGTEGLCMVLSLSILIHNTSFWNARTRTLHDMQHCNRLDLYTS